MFVSRLCNGRFHTYYSILTKGGVQASRPINSTSHCLSLTSSSPLQGIITSPTTDNTGDVAHFAFGVCMYSSSPLEKRVVFASLFLFCLALVCKLLLWSLRLWVLWLFPNMLPLSGNLQWFGLFNSSSSYGNISLRFLSLSFPNCKLLLWLMRLWVWWLFF